LFVYTLKIVCKDVQLTFIVGPHYSKALRSSNSL
jgi:hypothetical protein